jgi:hypothetical protein
VEDRRRTAHLSLVVRTSLRRVLSGTGRHTIASPSVFSTYGFSTKG